ncbi:MAG: hypothetical protein FJ009_19070 [Chloroflexi bacterium]|nr:hypothetical protein [Chloroflexota bacterium]
MKPKILTLKADIAADTQAIAEIYSALNRYPDALANEEQMIAVAYHLHNLYCAFESIFQRVAEVFENQIGDQSGWHVALLHRMTLDIEGIRPALISSVTFDDLDELRRFRHLFRSAYRLHLDLERLALVRKKARTLERTYTTDLEHFVSFLDGLLADD